MTSPPFDLKSWLDVHVVPFLHPEPSLELHSVLVNRSPATSTPAAVLIWLLSKTGADWAPALKRLLEAGGFSFDYTREPQIVAVAPGRAITLFGGDGMPFIGANGMAMARLHRRGDDGVDLIMEVGYRFPSGKTALAAVRSFFDQFGTDPAAIMARFAPRFGAA